MRSSNKKGISGWLILVAIGLVASPLMLYLTRLSVYPGVFESGGWYVLTNPDSEKYVEWFALLLCSEIAFNLILFSGIIYLNFLFFLKKKIFPKAYIAFMTASLLYIPINIYLTNLLFPQTTLFNGEVIKNICIALISALIWIPYMLMSHRVKNTFIEEYDAKKMTISSLTIISIFLIGYFSYLNKIKYKPENMTIEDKLILFSMTINKNLPRILDSETQLDSVYADANNLQYYHSLLNYIVSDINTHTLQQNLRQNIVSSACADSTSLTFLQGGATLSYIYNDKNGAYITSVQLNNSDCSGYVK